MKRGNYLAISLLILFYSCHQQKEMDIQPINKEFNEEYLTGKGLDTNFFNTTDVTQYYQVANSGGLTADEILTNLHHFSLASYPPDKLFHIQQLTILFYKKKLFVDYNDHLYESARDNDTRRLSDYHDDLLASISFERINNDPKKISLKRILYEKGKFKKEMVDTIIVP